MKVASVKKGKIREIIFHKKNAKKCNLSQIEKTLIKAFDVHQSEHILGI